MDDEERDEPGGVSPRQAFGQVMRELRRKRGISQERLGQEAGFHRTYVSLLERGIKSPSLNALFELASVLDTTVTELVRQAEARVSRLPNRDAPRH